MSGLHALPAANPRACPDTLADRAARAADRLTGWLGSDEFTTMIARGAGAAVLFGITGDGPAIMPSDVFTTLTEARDLLEELASG
jgi:hypothetical protein